LPQLDIFRKKTMAPILPPTDAAHLLRRTGFGVSPSQLAAFTQLPSREAAVDKILDVNWTPSVSSPVPFTGVTDQYAGWNKLNDWWLNRMRTSTTPIVEKMVLFWHGHFCTGIDKVKDAGVLAQQHFTLRKHAGGDFHALAQAVSIDPAMLVYLDNAFNVVGKPQENFARELMELFTLGVGNYSQDDVVALARAWTGHSCDMKTGRTYQFYPAWHDNGSKALFGLPAKNWNGPEALTEILKGSKAVPASRFIAAKVFSFFAYPIDPSDPVITPIAATFRSSNLNIKELLRAIFKSDAFWSDTARKALVRSPIEWFVAGMQATGLDASTITTETEALAGQILFLPPDVAGWGANDYWLSTSSLWGRSQWAVTARYYGWKGSCLKSVDSIAAVPAKVQKAFDEFGIVDPSPATRAALEAAVSKAIADGDKAYVRPLLMHLLLLSPDFLVA
jgi:hypothetical protein